MRKDELAGTSSIDIFLVDDRSRPATTTARIRVTWTADGSIQDPSNVNFRIQ